jgi:hypothetical protein
MEIVGETICGSPQRIPCLDTARAGEKWRFSVAVGAG